MIPTTQQGFLLISTIVLLVVGGLLAGSIAHVFLLQARSGVNQIETTNALYIADAGVQRATHELLSRDALLGITCEGINNNVNFTNVAFGDGEFTVQGTSYISDPASILEETISETATIIPITDTSYDYAPSGRVGIDSELIDYHGVSTNSAVCGESVPRCLLNAKRGRGETNASAHGVGALVEQNQCYLISTGGVPDLTDPRARRTVSQSITGGGIGVALGQVP